MVEGSNNQGNDFNAGAIAQSVNQHDADILLIKETLDKLEEKLTKPKEFAKIVEAAQDDSKLLDKILSKIFCSMLKDDPEVKKCISEQMKKADRKAVYALLKKWGGLITAAIIFILGGITIKIIDILFS